jgi:hypothetical protein
MTTKYRLVPTGATNPYAMIESFDLDQLKATRDTLPQGGTITAVDVTYFVENDPEPQMFDTWDLAKTRETTLIEQVAQNFYLGEVEQMLNPQPEGLND